MMKYPNFKGAFALLTVCMMGNFFVLPQLSARIGESKPELERRLFSRGGLAYRDATIIEARRSDMVYEEFLPYLVSDVDVQIYHKSADMENKAMRSKFNPKRMLPGWDLHVVYINGVSALEIYQRSGKMTEQELNLLLLLQGDGKNWVKRDNDGLDAEDDEKRLTAFGFEMVRKDGVVRAKNVKRGILFIDAVRDEQFAKARNEDRNATAPESVNGF